MKKQLKQLSKVFSSSTFLLIYLLGLFFLFLYPSLHNYFVGDDFSWLRWAATSEQYTLLLNFIDAQGFFFRPIPKLLIFIQYYFFGLNSYPYHIVNLFFNYAASIGAYFLFLIYFKKKTQAFLGALLFSFIPSHSQDLYWIATISTTVSAAFVLFGLIMYYFARTRDNWVYYLSSYALFALSVLTYENTVIFIGLMVLVDAFLIEKKHLRKLSTKLFPYFVSILIIGLYLALRLNAHAAGFSGDYNYNLAKALPNSIGNFLGYIFLFFAGENSLPLYTFMRNSLKTYAVGLTIAGAFLIAFLGGFVFEHKEKIRLGDRSKLFIFGMLFAALSLLPYLPLGNITLRYVYLPSFGFIVMCLAVLDGMMRLFITKKQYNKYAYFGITIIVGILCYSGLQMRELYWRQASQVTYGTVQSLIGHEITKPNTNVFFYNIPTKIGEAYIFPVGLPDAVYFVNSDPSTRVFILPSKSEAVNLAKSLKAKNTQSYVFTFDKNNVLQSIE